MADLDAQHTRRVNQPGGRPTSVARLLFAWAMPRALLGLAGLYAFALLAWSVAP